MIRITLIPLVAAVFFGCRTTEETVRLDRTVMANRIQFEQDLKS